MKALLYKSGKRDVWAHLVFDECWRGIPHYDDRSDYSRGFLGPQVQYLFTPFFWLSGDAGLGLMHRKIVDQPDYT